MKIKTSVFVAVLGVVAVLLGVVRYHVLPTYFPQLLKPQPTNPVQNTPTPQQTETEQTNDLAINSVASVSAQLLQNLTPRQKVAQIMAVPIVFSSDPKQDSATASAATAEIPGFITVFGQKVSALQVDRLTNQLRLLSLQPKYSEGLNSISQQDRQLLRPMTAVDHEGGTVQRLTGEGITIIPSAVEQCAMDGGSLDTLLRRAAKELSGIGVDIVFAPVIDLGVNHPVMKTRLCSDDPEKVLDYAERWIRAMEASNVIPVVKHYPGIGQTTTDLHIKAEEIDFNPREHALYVSLLTKYLRIGLMTTHVSLGRQDGSEAVPCTYDPGCLQLLDVEGQHLVFTDGLEMQAAQLDGKKLSDLATEAVLAGHQVIVLGRSVTPEQVDQLVTELADTYQRNSAFRQKTDQALQAIWYTKNNHWQINTQK